MIPQRIYISVVRQVGEFFDDDTHNYNIIIEGGKYIQYYSMVQKSSVLERERESETRGNETIQYQLTCGKQKITQSHNKIGDDSMTDHLPRRYCYWVLSASGGAILPTYRYAVVAGCPRVSACLSEKMGYNNKV